MLESLHLLDSYKEQQILFVGVGNILRRDDGIGVYIVNQISPRQGISKLSVEVSLENYISKINRIAPDILILIDCVDFQERPGYFKLIPINELTEDVLHSHHITLSKITSFFQMPVFVLGIQPESLAVGEELSESVKNAGNAIASYIHSISSIYKTLSSEKTI